MKQKFETEKDLNKRADLIEQNAYCTDKVGAKRPFSPGEMEQFREEYVALMEVFDNSEEELKALSAPIKEKMKSVKKAAKEFMQKLKMKCEIVETEIYGFDNQEMGTMDFYDINGEYVSSRKLLSTERQIKLSAVNQ